MNAVNTKVAKMPQPETPPEKVKPLRPWDGKRLPSYINNRANASEPLKRRERGSSTRLFSAFRGRFRASVGQTPQPATPRGVAA
jgi:hypothetical protein